MDHHNLNMNIFYKWKVYNDQILTKFIRALDKGFCGL